MASVQLSVTVPQPGAAQTHKPLFPTTATVLSVPDNSSGLAGTTSANQLPITAKTPTVVFCLSFTAKGLFVEDNDGEVTIVQEGTIPKFVNKVSSISFSGKRAIENGQTVLYITERCVFRLTAEGLELIEVYPGIDIDRDILSQMAFPVKVADNLK